MAHVTSGLSRKLLTRVLSVYFVLTLIVTFGQVFTEYLSAKAHIQSELQILRNTFAGSLTRALWELNDPQTQSIAEGLLQLPVIEGVQIRDENNTLLAALGKTTEMPPVPVHQSVLAEHSDGLFSYSFPLIYEFSGRVSHVGDVTLYSSFNIVIDRIEVGIFFLIGNAVVKTTFLVFLFMTAFRQMLSEPLASLTEQMSRFNPAHPEESRITHLTPDNNEIRQLQYSYNQVLEDFISSQKKLANARGELEHAYRQVDEQNLQLEQEVARKTANLSQIMLDLEQQKDELLDSQRKLRTEIEQRRQVEDELRQRNKELASTVLEVNETRDQLVESERLASLGGLVAGITHDVNTPVGISITATSSLQDEFRQLRRDLADGKVTQRQMNEFIEHGEQATALLMTNLRRAAELVASFKQISIDQANEAVRTFNLHDYLHEIMQAMAPAFKQGQHTYTINCPVDVIMQCAPGAIAQLITNMVTNSLTHGFELTTGGEITINVARQDEQLTLVYKDNGKGLEKAQLERLFEAFFTTRQARGGSGLGTHIMYNLVTQTLGGTIYASSRPDAGLTYTVCLPLIQQPANQFPS